MTASASWTIALDNVSKLIAWQSDALCKASTGAQWIKRALYSDDGLAILPIKRVLVLNGIDPEVTRGDLAERLIRVDLEPVEERLTDEEVAELFTASHPALLGALFDLAVSVLSVLGDTVVEDPPRMASFAKVVAAVDVALDTDGLRRYRAMVTGQVGDAAEGDMFAQSISQLLKTRHEWTGTAADLLAVIKLDADPNDRLPRSPQAVGAALARCAPSLRAQGYVVKRLPRTEYARGWLLAGPPQVQE